MLRLERHHAILVAATIMEVACGSPPAAHEPILVNIEPAEPVEEITDPASRTAPRLTVKDRWIGDATQASGSNWEIAVEVTSFEPGRCAEVTYDTCAGYWDCTDRSNKLELFAVEFITSGHGCFDRVDVRLTLSPDGMTAKFKAVVPGDSAAGTLERVLP